MTWSAQPTPIVELVSFDPPDVSSTSGSFRGKVRTGSGERYCWIKPLKNPEGPCATLAEMILARVAPLIGAPVCEGIFVDPGSCAGALYLRDERLTGSLAFGSPELEDILDSQIVRVLPSRDNRRRMAALAVLYRWCLGGDGQWFYLRERENAIISHDHGRYLLRQEGWTRRDRPSWSATTLADSATVERLHRELERRADPQALLEFAARLEAVTPQALCAALDPIAGAWAKAPEIVFDDGLSLDLTLRAVGLLLERRQSLMVADLRRGSP